MTAMPNQHPDDGLPDAFRLLVHHNITLRQLECLYWVEQGKSANDIGGILGISGRTVEGHLLKACTHFEVRTRFQAVLRVRDLGLFELVAP